VNIVMKIECYFFRFILLLTIKNLEFLFYSCKGEYFLRFPMCWYIKEMIESMPY